MPSKDPYYTDYKDPDAAGAKLFELEAAKSGLVNYKGEPVLKPLAKHLNGTGYRQKYIYIDGRKIDCGWHVKCFYPA